MLAPGISVGATEMYLEQLIEKTRKNKLSEQRYWNLLLHYRPERGGRRKSTVDDPQFFLSKNGKSHPQAEMEATLKGFFAGRVHKKEHARCRFVARYAWIKTQLQIDESRLPLVVCSDFEKALAEINPQSLTLIFPVAYMGSPASLFGHTFLRIDGAHGAELLSTALNYAAHTKEETGLSYVLKGIFGGFHGYYYTRPYHEKIREYTAIEHRDIWEYHLNFTQAEVLRIVRHVWEMRDMHSAYYFLDENCSYAALYLLEIARPALYLTQNTNRLLVIPISTIRVC